MVLSYEPGEPKRNQMLLYWLRKPFIDRENVVESIYKLEKNLIEDEYKAWIHQAIQDDLIEKAKELQKNRDLSVSKISKEKESKLGWYFYLKPILLCKYCFPSFYGTIIFIMLHGFHLEMWKEWIISIVCAVIWVKIIDKITE